MRRKAWLLVAVSVLILVALMLQTVVVARLNLPGVGPDLLLLAVFAVGLSTSSNYGAITGFVAGLLSDVLPPDQTTLGVTAIVLTVVGFVAGTIRDPRGLAPVQLFGIIGGLAICSSLAYIFIAVLVEGRVFDQEQTAWSVVGVTAYTSVLGLLLVPPISRRLSRITERLARRPSSIEPVFSELAQGSGRR